MSPEEEKVINRNTMKLQEHLYKAIKQRDQYKAENEKLRERNKKLEKRCNQKVRRYLRGGLQQMKIEDLESKYDGMKTERNSLIDDLSWYKAKVSRLERENEKQLALLKEFRKLIDYKLTLHQGSSMYREYRSKLDQLGVK